MRITVAADHTGIELKARLLLWLGERGRGAAGQRAGYGAQQD
jgi:hypothetical protein